MRALILATMLAGLLSGCTGTNLSINTLQFSGAEEAFPTDYRAVATKLVQKKTPEPGGFSVSYPRLIIGKSPFGPKRWYMCILGVTTGRTPPKHPTNLTQLATDVLNPQDQTPVFQLIVFLHEGQVPGVRQTFNADLCKDGVYEPLATDQQELVSVDPEPPALAPDVEEQAPVIAPVMGDTAE